MENNVIQRIKKLMKYYNISENSLADKLKISQSTLNSALKQGKDSINSKILEGIVDLFPDANEKWLLSGKGKMLNKNIKESLDVEVHEKKTGRNLIPFYDAETTGGNVGYVSSSNVDVHLKGYVDAGDWFAGRETAAIKHVGDSMKEYPDGCILAVRAVENFRLLVPGKNYVIETSEYRITKKVQFGAKPGTLVLHSTNRDKYDDGTLIHQPFTIELEDVRRIFSVLGYIVSQSGESHFIKI